MNYLNEHTQFWLSGVEYFNITPLAYHNTTRWTGTATRGTTLVHHASGSDRALVMRELVKALLDSRPQETSE